MDFRFISWPVLWQVLEALNPRGASCREGRSKTPIASCITIDQAGQLSPLHRVLVVEVLTRFQRDEELTPAVGCARGLGSESSYHVPQGQGQGPSKLGCCFF